MNENLKGHRTKGRFYIRKAKLGFLKNLKTNVIIGSAGKPSYVLRRHGGLGGCFETTVVRIFPKSQNATQRLTR